VDRAEQLLAQYRELIAEMSRHADTLTGDARREFADRVSREPHPAQLIA